MQSCADEYKILSHRSRDTVYPTLGRQISSYQAGTPGKGPAEPESEEDDLNENWPGNDDEPEMQHKIVHCTESPSATAIDPSLHELPNVNDRGLRISTDDTDHDMVESSHFVNDRSVGAGALESVESDFVSRRVELVEHTTVVKRDVVSEEGVGLASTSEQQVSETKIDALAAIADRVSALFEADGEFSDDSLPDIVDGDPDDLD